MKIIEINYHNNNFHLIECKFTPNLIERFLGKKQNIKIIQVKGGLRPEYFGTQMDLYYADGTYISKLNPIHKYITKWYASLDHDAKSEALHAKLR